MQTDFKLEVDECRNELGLKNKHISNKVNLFSLFRLQEMMLQYLMIRDIHALTEDEKKFASVEIKDHT